MTKSKTRNSALPRKRSTAALSLQSARHRQRVIPDKRATSNERAMNEEVRAVAYRTLLHWSDLDILHAERALMDSARCTDWKTGTDHGACKDVRCEHCTINFDEGAQMTNTLCPKIGAAQWTCTGSECTCHLKARAVERDRDRSKP
jgi:hypothetical protein